MLNYVVLVFRFRIEIETKTTSKNQRMNIIDRLKSKTPKFYRTLRNVGLALVAAGGVLVAAPVAIPAVLVTIGGYLIVAGSVATAVAQTVVEK